MSPDAELFSSAQLLVLGSPFLDPVATEFDIQGLESRLGGNLLGRQFGSHGAVLMKQRVPVLIRIW
jgi:hypothetical protein